MLLRKSILFITNSEEDKGKIKNDLSAFGIKTRILPYNAESIFAEIASARPTCVLLDAFAVDGDIFEIIRKIKACDEEGNISVGVVSAIRSEKLKRIILAGGASFYLTKPIDSQILAEIITSGKVNYNCEEETYFIRGFSYFKQSITLKGHG